MRQIFWLSWIALGTMLSVNLPVVSQEIAPDIRDSNKDSILEQFKKGDKNTLIFGVRSDSYPISYKENDSWRGFCVELAGILKDELGKLKGIEPNQNSIKIVYKDISAREIEKERFDILRNKNIDIECGPNSIPGKVSDDNFFHPRYQNIIFSEPFFVTGTRLLIKKDQLDKVNKNPLFEGEPIGVIKNTTTYSVLKNVYRLANRKSPNPPTRKNGIEYLKKESVIAYATDSLILEAELERKKYLDNPDNYYLYPENNFLSIEPYGLAFHDSEKEWRDFVDRVLQTPGAERIIEELLENKYDSISNLIEREENDTRYLETVELASKVLSIILVVTVLVAFIWLIRYLRLKAQTAEIIFDEEDEFDWNAFIYTFKMVQVEHDVVLLAINNELSIKDNNDLSFQVGLYKSHLKKEKFIKQFRSKYELALEDVKKHYKLDIKEAQSHGQSLKTFQTKHPQTKTLNDLIDRLSINILASQPLNIGANSMTNDNTKTFNTHQEGVNIANNDSVVKDNASQKANQHNYTPEQKQSLAEAATEIQELLDQLSETYSATEAEQKAAEDLASRAKKDPSLRNNLKNWSRSILTKSTEAGAIEFGKEAAKRVIPMALSFL
ncbi:MAG: transporter substrate-binding domain-containing protein [Okeania sp. SIO2C9]|uniref:transporter substrate-binding domain-containing protein n=1 Tax=Okeania sp. SIO2C9 TaxID=2607791 RepID=UPI0013BFF832|nr:transporter substrate-binding domain-containing protein [Okeania sp. SIO2C9]NEQ72676.1 transporter substrate-binding domain-containing protein [Okeania sp. SIO2C9]